MEFINYMNEDRTNLKFGEIVKEERNRHGLSVRELSELSGVSTAYISKIENNKRAYPSKETIFNISFGFDEFLIENYDFILYDDITIDFYSYKLFLDFLKAKDSNFLESDISKLTNEYLSHYIKRFGNSVKKNNEITQEIFNNEIELEKGNSEGKVIDKPNYDLEWLLSQKQFEVFYGRSFLTKPEILNNQKLTPKLMYYYNSLDESDLITIKKLIEAYLESKYEKINNKKEFFYNSIDIDNQHENKLDWYFLDN